MTDIESVSSSRACSITNQESDDSSSAGSGCESIASDYLASRGVEAATTDLDRGSSAVKGKSINSTTSACVLINFISVGYILNPSAFAQAGTLLSSICLALVSMQTFISGTFVLEACARAEAFKERSASTTLDVSSGSRRSNYSVKILERTFEMSELCRIFMGPWMRNFFTLTTAGDLYGITWAMAAVFGSSLADDLPIGTSIDYQIYIYIFMVIVVPISCMSISGQVRLQMVFLGGRTIMLGLMIATTAVAYVSTEPHFGEQAKPASDVPLADFSNIVLVLQTCIFSTAFQFAVPGLTAETKHKPAMVPMIKVSVGYIYATNLIISLLMAIYFGADTEKSSNLNWLNYHGGTWDGSGDLTRSGWATGISTYIVIFAALDGLAVYPLIAVSLGDILMGAYYENAVHEAQESWKRRAVFRLMASIPQAVGALFVHDLGALAKYAGVFTLLSYTTCPSILALKSKKAMEDIGLRTTTRYSTIFTSNSIVEWTLIIASAFLIVGVVVDAII